MFSIEILTSAKFQIDETIFSKAVGKVYLSYFIVAPLTSLSIVDALGFMSSIEYLNVIRN